MKFKFRLIRLLNKFKYELVSYSQLRFYTDAVFDREHISSGKFELEFVAVKKGRNKYEVRTKEGSPVSISVKTFKIEDYGSEEYARACAQELCDKLNERP